MNAVHQAIAGGFAFGVGASVGSFLNVCVWRIRARMSLIRPASRCPRCGTTIAARDNVPVLGWLLLRGRCRSCALPISPRYPMVEGVVGLAFAGILLAEIAASPVDLLDRDPWLVVAWLIYHWTLLSLLVTAALIEHDRDAAQSLERRPVPLNLSTVSVGPHICLRLRTWRTRRAATLNLGLLAVYLRGHRHAESP